MATTAEAPKDVVSTQWELDPSYKKLRSDVSVFADYYRHMAEISFHGASKYQFPQPVLRRQLEPLNKSPFVPMLTIKCQFPPTKNPQVFLTITGGRLEMDYVRQLLGNADDILEKMEKVKSIMYQFWLDNIKSCPEWNAFYKTAFNKDGTPAFPQLGKDFVISGLKEFSMFGAKTPAPPRPVARITNDPFAEEGLISLTTPTLRTVKHSAVVGDDSDDQVLVPAKRSKVSLNDLFDF